MANSKANLCTGDKLIYPLGPWQHQPHQVRQWFYDDATDIVLEHTSTGGKSYSVFPHVRKNRCLWYGNPVECAPPDATALFPTTIKQSWATTICSFPSKSTIPTVREQPSKSIWNPANTPPVFQNTPVFFQHLIGSTPPTQNQCELISDTIQDEELVTCSDGAYNPSTGTGSHSWIIRTRSGVELACGAGPTDGNPDFMSSYRSKLSGIPLHYT
jgi:hypothetical protein